MSSFTRQGTKADLLSCLEKCIQSATPSQPKTDVYILDGFVVVNFLKPLAANTFDEYAIGVVIP